MAVRLLALGGVAAGLGILLLRLVPDVRGKPLFEDEAVAGLIAARPLPEVVVTVMWERGGGPLHFVLGHAALVLEPSPYALRWLSIVFALATIPLCFDIARRLGGPAAGVVAALVAATSSFLLVYGTFGRMYSLYAFVAALAVDLFLVARERRTWQWALAAAGAAWLLPAVHPYGLFLVFAEGVVALWLWRGRPLRPALPVLAVGLAMIPFLVADVRLASRFSVGLDGEDRLATPTSAFGHLGRALAATAGGEGIAAGVAVALVAAGLVVLARRDRPFVALCLLAFLVPPLLLVLGRSGTAPGLSPRHVMYVLPLAAALIGVAVAHALRGRGLLVSSVAVAAVGVLLALAPFGGIRDPRDWTNDVLGSGEADTALGSEERLSEAAAWLDANVEAGDSFFPYSVAFFSGLPATGRASGLPYSQSTLMLRAVDRLELPVPRVLVSVPAGDAPVDVEAFEGLLGPGFEVHPLGAWLVVEGTGPFADERAVLAALHRALSSAREAIPGASNELAGFLRVSLATVCGAFRAGWGEECPPASAR